MDWRCRSHNREGSGVRPAELCPTPAVVLGAPAKEGWGVRGNSLGNSCLSHPGHHVYRTNRVGLLVFPRECSGVAVLVLGATSGVS